MDVPGGFKIGTVSRRTGVSTATLRLWEEHYGLLAPRRTPGRQRVYTDTDIERVLYVRHLTSSRGYSLQGIAAILDEARHNLPPLAQGLLQDEAAAQPPPLVQMAAELRSYLEDVHLRLVTSRDEVREGQLLAQIHAVMRRFAQASTLAEAAAALATGTGALIGNQSTMLAVYLPREDLIRSLITASGGRIVATEGEPVPVSTLVPAFRAAFRNGQPYYLSRIPVDELPPDIQRRARVSGVQSLYAHPLTVARRVVGVLAITSQRVDGVSAEVRGICGRVAGISGPALAYFAAQDHAPAA